MNVGNILTLIGGLGLFLYGMRVMSDSIEKAAGAKMRSFLAFFTKNWTLGLDFKIILLTFLKGFINKNAY